VVTIRESFGYKPVLKSLLIAARCAAGSVPRDAVERAIARVTETYADPYLQPDLGIFLDGDIDLAMRRRSGEGRGIGVGEDYGIAGQPDSYEELQRECRDRFSDVADAWNWYRLDAGLRTPDELAEEVAEKAIRPLLN
jgi:thymidylate kinase